MRKIKDVLRLAHEGHRNTRQVALSHRSASTVAAVNQTRKFERVRHDRRRLSLTGVDCKPHAMHLLPVAGRVL
jgi:hypothetical protein